MKSWTRVTVWLMAILGSVATFAQDKGVAALNRQAVLQAQFDAKVKADVEDPFQKGLAELNAKYAQAIEQSFKDAQSAGNLKDALKWKEEMDRHGKGEPMPAEDIAELPEGLKRYRTGYRQSFDLLWTRRGEGQANLRKIYVAELQKIVAELTKQGDLAAGVAVQAKIDEIMKAGVSPLPAGGVASPTGGLPVTPGPGNVGSSGDLSRATKAQPFTNKMGMKFVPVPGSDALFCIHEVRWKDFAEFARETPNLAPNWKPQRYEDFDLVERPEDHPVVHVTHQEAKDYCAWLSQKDGNKYRLPSDREWSAAVGLGRKEKWGRDDTPQSVVKDSQLYPWGTAWPPPKGAGNYSDESRRAKAANKSGQVATGYDDGFPTTAPVMSFPPNEFGLYDMGGNVWEWTGDWWNPEAKTQIAIRGGGWYAGDKNSLLSSARAAQDPNGRNAGNGFRIVVEPPAR
jgi:formylglycine-generating enzyme required for sulfatase activity